MRVLSYAMNSPNPIDTFRHAFLLPPIEPLSPLMTLPPLHVLVGGAIAPRLADEELTLLDEGGALSFLGLPLGLLGVGPQPYLYLDTSFLCVAFDLHTL